MPSLDQHRLSVLPDRTFADAVTVIWYPSDLVPSGTKSPGKCTISPELIINETSWGSDKTRNEGNGNEEMEMRKWK